MPRRSSKPDINEVAFRVVLESTRDRSEPSPPVKPKKKRKNPAAVALGRLGGKKGGTERARRLSPERRSEIAKQAAAARWQVPS